MIIDDARKEFISELLNIGVERAGTVVSELVGARVVLEVPEVDICRSQDVLPTLTALRGNDIIAVSQGFTGVLSGDAALVINGFSGNLIVHRLLQQIGDDGDPATLRDEALTEIGNIVANSLVGAWSKVFCDPFEFGLPVFRRGTLEDCLAPFLGTGDAQGRKTYAVSGSAHFSVNDFFIMGTLLVFFNEKSIETLMGAAAEQQ